MKLLLAATLCFTLFAISCKNRSSINEQVTSADSLPDSASTRKNYLPIPLLLESDKSKVEQDVAGILRKITINGKTDSSFIKADEFKKHSSVFDLPGLDSAYFVSHYTESSIVDETTETVQLLYAAKTPDLPVSKLIVYIKKGAVSDKVDMIYLDKNFQKGDTSISQRLTWKFGRYYLVATQEEGPGNYQLRKMEKVIWEPSDYGE